MAQPQSYGLSNFIDTMNRAESSARSSRGAKIMREADITKPEGYAKTLQALGKYGDVNSQKQFLDIASAYEQSLSKRKPQSSLALPKYEALNPDQMGQFAKQQHDLISIIEEASSNIDESGYPALVQTAEKFGITNLFPDNFNAFNQNRDSLSKQLSLSKKAMQSMYSNVKTDEPTNKFVHAEFFGNEPYDPNVNWTKLVPFKLQKERANKPSSGDGKSLAERRFENLLEQQRIEREDKKLERSEKDLLKESASAQKSIKDISGAVVKSIGVEDTEAEPLVMLLFSKSKKIDPYQLSADLQMHLKKKFGQYPSAEDVSSELKKMIDHLDKKNRVEKDKSPKSQTQKRLEAVDSLRKSGE